MGLINNTIVISKINKIFLKVFNTKHLLCFNLKSLYYLTINFAFRFFKEIYNGKYLIKYA